MTCSTPSSSLDTKAAGFKHCDVITAVSAADHLLCGESDTGKEFTQGVCLIDILRHDLQKERIGAVNI